MHLHAAWRWVVLLLAVSPLAYYVFSTIAAWRFFRRERARKLPEFAPPVSVLKAVRGVDFATHENYSSFCRQNYPNYEIIFAVNEADDPAAAEVRRVIREFPGREIRLLVGAENLGANRKVNKLARMTSEARHEFLILADGDVRVGPNFLREVVAPFASGNTGAVTSFYAGIAENNLGAAYMENNDLVSALPHFLAAAQYAPDLGSAHYNLGVILQRQGQLPEAAVQYRQAIAYAADAGEAAHTHNNLGVLYLTLNNLPVAKAEFDKALSLNPNEVNSYIARGTVEYQLEKMDDAIADFSQACSLARSPVAYFWLGRAYESKGDFPHAKAAYKFALQLAPAMQEAGTRLAFLQALTGQ